MKKMFFASILVSISFIGFSQESDYIKLDNGVELKNYMPYWKTAVTNQAVAIFDQQNKPLMLIMLPANGGHSPVAGTYQIGDGSKRSVKKGSQTAKIEYEPGFISEEGGGTLVIEEKNELVWFSAENISIINPKTKETHKLSIKMRMFIEKK